MKKLFSLFSVFALAAILGISTASAQTTIAAVEKLWSRTLDDIGTTLADTRQGAGRDGKVYLLNKSNQSFVAISETSVDTIFQGPLEVEGGVWANLDGTAYALDDAGNFVMEGTFPNVPSHLVLRKADGSVVKDLAITGLARTDYINATGDVFSADGGHVFVYGNSANLLVYTIANGKLVGEAKEIAGLANANNNYVLAGDANTQIVHHRSYTGWMKVENGVETLIEGMEGFKNTTMGGDIITLAGKEFYIYPSGTTNYSSEFVVRNMTDGSFAIDKTNRTTLFYSNTQNKGSSTIPYCCLNASKIDDNNAYIHVYNADGAAVFKLSMAYGATISLDVNDATMGTVEGAGDAAVGGKATVKAIPALSHSFVAWLNGTDTVSTAAEYSFEVKEDLVLTAHFQKEENQILTLTTSDLTLGSITLPEDIVLGENSVVYGTTMVLTAVPAKGGAFVGWYNNEGLYSEDYTIEITMLNNVSLTAKFIETLSLAYELNGGVTNDYGWTSKGAVALELQKDYNAAYGTREWAKLENGYIYYNLNGTWTREDQVPEGTECTITGFLQSSTWNASDNWKNLITNTHANKYAWLHDVIVATRTTAGMDTTEADMNETTYREELSAFFLCSPANDIWPKSPSYEVAGKYASFGEIWEHAFANPTEVDVEVVLNAPYKDGYIFDGWYTNANFSGEPITIVSPTSAIAGGKLYAKWIRKGGMLNSPRAWAYDLTLAQEAEAYTFTFKATTAANATLIFTDAEGTELAAVELGAVEAGLNTKTLAASELPQGKKVNWAVKMAGEAITSFVEVTDESKGIYNFYLPQGVAVDNNSESASFGQIYVAAATDGAADGGSDRADTQKRGIFVYDQELNELNPTSNVGILPSNVTLGATSTSRQAMKRIVINPLTNEVAFAHNAEPMAVWAVAAENVGGEAKNLIEGLGFTSVNALCFNEEGTLYVMESAGYPALGSLYKVVGGVVDTIFANSTRFVNTDLALVSDNRGGVWICQNRGQLDAYNQLTHVNASGVIDFEVNTDTPNGFDGKSTSRGSIAYNPAEDILAMSQNTDGGYGASLYQVAYDETTGVPSLTLVGETPSMGRNVDGLAFDYAGDLYGLSANKERLYKYAVPTDNNVCTVPAASRYSFEISNEQNQITYTSSNGRVVSPNALNVFGANIVSNTYENGVGTITFDGPVTSIGSYAFHDCETLTSIIVPNSVKTIGYGAFSGAVSLDSIFIGSAVTSIGEDVFGGCGMLTSIEVDANNTTFDCREDCNAIIKTSNNILVAGCKTTIIPNTVKGIGDYAFAGSWDMTSIEIPEGVETIGSSAFGGCTLLRSVTLPNTLTTIGNDAFSNCRALTSITIPSSVKKIGAYVFWCDHALNTIYIEANTPPTLGVNPFYSAPVSYCFIPCGTLDAYEASAWANYMGDFVEDCVNQKCGDYLYWKYHDSELSVAGYGDMYDYDIDPRPWEDKRNKMQSVSLPDGMTSVGASAFADCKYIKSVTIPASVEKIDDSAFEDCRMLSTLTFAEPSALTTIGNWAFYNNHELKNLVIPEGVSEIGYAAFYGCTYLDELSLPESLQYIADNGFALCAKLCRMNVSATTPPTVEARTFEDVDRAIPVYVPTEAVSRYKAAPVWEDFNIVGRDNAPTAVENSKVDSCNAQKLLRNGQLLILRDGKTYTIMGEEL